VEGTKARVLFPVGWKRVRGGTLIPGDRILDIREGGAPRWYTFDGPHHLRIKSCFPDALIIRRSKAKPCCKEV
jgi:hypothetical protein